MLSSLLTDMCLDTINSTTKFSPVLSRCNFAGVNGMSLHLQTEKLESITLSWQLSAARLLRCSSPGEPGPCPQVLSCYRRTTPQPAPGPLTRPGLPSPPSRDPPAGGRGRRGSSAVTRNTRPGKGRIPLPATAGVPRRRRRSPLVHPAPSPCLPAAAADLRHRPVPPPRTEDSAGPRGHDGRERDGNLLGVRGIPIYGV